MQFFIPYGKGQILINLKRENVAGYLNPTISSAVHSKEVIARSLRNPIKSLTLQELVQQKREGPVIILVTDVSRPIPYQELLPPIIRELKKAGISGKELKFIIATGAHRPNTAAENREVFGSLVDQYCFKNHNCDTNLKGLGNVTGGVELQINADVAAAGLLIITSCIMPHNLAGFSGGPKMILPGIAGRKTIEENHSLMKHTQVGPGNVRENPISQQILEALQLSGVDFSINVILNSQNQITQAFAGHPEAAWRAGCESCRQLYQFPLPEPAEVVIVGGGGYPRDANLYQAVKALVNGGRFLKEGGTIVLLAKCQEGMGEPLFEEWMMAAKNSAEVVERFETKGFRLGAHKAYMLCEILQRKEVILVSELAATDQQVPLLKNVQNWESAAKLLSQKHGPDYRALILPLAGLVFPLSGQEIPSNK